MSSSASSTKPSSSNQPPHPQSKPPLGPPTHCVSLPQPPDFQLTEVHTGTPSGAKFRASHHEQQPDDILSKSAVKPPNAVPNAAKDPNHRVNACQQSGSKQQATAPQHQTTTTQPTPMNMLVPASNEKNRQCYPEENFDHGRVRQVFDPRFPIFSQHMRSG